MSDEQKNIKLCRTCGEVKSLEENFYKRTNLESYNKVCKSCLKKKREGGEKPKNKSKKIYIRRPTGFAKLPINVQKDILYDIRIGLNYLEIAKKYDLCYKSLTLWKKHGKIKLFPELPPEQLVLERL